MASPLPSDSVQEALVDVNLEVSMLGNFFFGLYTVLYVLTLYIFLDRRPSQQRTIIGIVSLSYLVYTINAGIAWSQFKSSIVNNGRTRETIFLAVYDDSPGWFKLSNDICSFLMAALADVLIIWRCYHVWDRLPYFILVPSFLLLSEIVIDFSVIILASAVGLKPTPKQGAILNTLIATSFFITCAVTLITTILISYRIHSMSREILPKNSRTRFRHVVDILIQSAAIYTLSAIAYGIPAIFPDTDSNLIGLETARMYRWTIFNFTAGVAPTIMVVRVVLAPKAKEGVSIGALNLSTLHFHSPSTAGNTTQLNAEGERATSSMSFKDSKVIDTQ